MIVLSAQRAPSRAHSQLSRWGRVQDFKEVCLPTARRLHTLGVRHVRWQLNPTLAVLLTMERHTLRCKQLRRVGKLCWAKCRNGSIAAETRSPLSRPLFPIADIRQRD